MKKWEEQAAHGTMWEVGLGSLEFLHLVHLVVTPYLGNPAVA